MYTSLLISRVQGIAQYANKKLGTVSSDGYSWAWANSMCSCCRLRRSIPLVNDPELTGIVFQWWTQNGDFELKSSCCDRFWYLILWNNPPPRDEIAHFQVSVQVPSEFRVLCITRDIIKTDASISISIETHQYYWLSYHLNCISSGRLHYCT